MLSLQSTQVFACRQVARLIECVYSTARRSPKLDSGGPRYSSDWGWAMAFSAVAVANEFLRRAEQDGAELTTMQLLKLVYLADGYHLGIAGEELVNSRPQAWRFGPVIPAVYHRFKHFGAESIVYDPREYDSHGIEYEGLPEERAFAEQLIDRVWEVYGNLDGARLSALTHRDGTPWSTTWNERGGSTRRHTVIDTDLIRQHYATLVR